MGMRGTEYWSGRPREGKFLSSIQSYSSLSRDESQDSQPAGLQTQSLAVDTAAFSHLSVSSTQVLELLQSIPYAACISHPEDITFPVNNARGVMINDFNCMHFILRGVQFLKGHMNLLGIST